MAIIKKCIIFCTFSAMMTRLLFLSLFCVLTSSAVYAGNNNPTPSTDIDKSIPPQEPEKTISDSTKNTSSSVYFPWTDLFVIDKTIPVKEESTKEEN